MDTTHTALFFLPNPTLMQERLHHAPLDDAAINIIDQRNQLLQHLSHNATSILEKIYKQQGLPPETATALAKQTTAFHQIAIAGGSIWYLGPQISHEIATTQVSLSPQTSYPVPSGSLVLLDPSINSEIPLKALSWSLDKTTNERYTLEDSSPVLTNIICYTENPHTHIPTPTQAYSLYLQDFVQPTELNTLNQPLIHTTWEIIERSPHPINACDIPTTRGGGILLRIP